MTTGSESPRRPAWVEIDLDRLRRNFAVIFRDKPPAVRLLSVVKDEAYGHGAVRVARTALECGASMLAVSNLDEALTLRDAGITAPILLLGQRPEDELPCCVARNLTCCLGDTATADALARVASRQAKRALVHGKIDTGMSRYGVRWTEALPLLRLVASTAALSLTGVMSHFAMSDERDKTFARLQCARFQEVLTQLAEAGIPPGCRHLCNSGGFLDLPEAHHNMVRLGILPLGVYPSAVCRRLPGLEPIMTVKARLANVRELQPGETVGYGMRYRATAPRRIATLPIGYADGFPRVRNLGHVLVHGQHAPILGGTAMDATIVDITDIPAARPWDEAVLQGRQGREEISAQDLAQWKGTVCYEVLAAWRARLPRVFLDSSPAP